MSTKPLPALPFDLCDPEGLRFDERPEDFVDLSKDPLIFSIRGIAYFKPRFALVGVDLARLISATEFRDAYDRWMRHELMLLDERLATHAAANPGGEHAELYALWCGDEDHAAALAERRVRRERLGLRVAS